MRRPQLKFSPYLVPSLFSIVWLPWYQLQWRTQVCQNQQPGITQPLQKPEAIEVLFIIEFYLALTRKYFLLGKDKLYACIIFTDPPALRGLTLTCSTMLSSWTVPTTGILSRTNWTLLKEKRTSPGTQTTSSCSSTELSPPPPILVSPRVCSAYTVHRQWLHFHHPPHWCRPVCAQHRQCLHFHPSPPHPQFYLKEKRKIISKIVLLWWEL